MSAFKGGCRPKLLIPFSKGTTVTPAIFGLPCTRIRGRNAMGQLLQTYLPLVIFIGIAFFISGALLLSPFLIAVRRPDPEKVSAYECGFDAFDDARMKFDVRFYLVSLLFII